jgi:hypothetical protein
MTIAALSTALSDLENDESFFDYSSWCSMGNSPAHQFTCTKYSHLCYCRVEERHGPCIFTFSCFCILCMRRGISQAVSGEILRNRRDTTQSAIPGSTASDELNCGVSGYHCVTTCIPVEVCFATIACFRKAQIRGQVVAANMTFIQVLCIEEA